MAKTIFLLGLMVATVSARQEWFDAPHCEGPDGKCCVTKCPPDWKGYNGHCYYFSSEPKTFRDSQTYCSFQRSNLVKLDGDGEKNFVKIQIGVHILGCPTQDSKLRTDISPQLCYFRSFRPLDQPSAEKFCQEYRGELVSVPDMETLQYINCEYPSSSGSDIWTSITLNTGTGNWEDVNGNTIANQNLFWDNGANQPSGSPNENCIFIRDNLFHDAFCTDNAYALCQINQDTSTWIGVSDAAHEGTFMDLFGNEIDLQDQDFEAGGPNGGDGADCVAYTLSSGKYIWEESDCFDRKPFVCERDPDCDEDFTPA